MRNMMLLLTATCASACVKARSAESDATSFDRSVTESGYDLLKPLPRDLEIEFARSALPEHLRAEATVYTLDLSSGFEVAIKGTNGFHTFVARNDLNAYRGSWEWDQYGDDIYIPIAFDAAGAKANMQAWFHMAKLQATGTPPAELRKTLQQNFQKGAYGQPERVGISYMISPIFRPYLEPQTHDKVVTLSLPHYMFYAKDVTNDDVGGKFLSAHPFVPTPGPHGYIIQAQGERERAANLAEHDKLLGDLCAFDTKLCLKDRYKLMFGGVTEISRNQIQRVTDDATKRHPASAKILQTLADFYKAQIGKDAAELAEVPLAEDFLFTTPVGTVDSRAKALKLLQSNFVTQESLLIHRYEVGEDSVDVSLTTSFRYRGRDVTVTLLETWNFAEDGEVLTAMKILVPIEEDRQAFGAFLQYVAETR